MYCTDISKKCYGTKIQVKIKYARPGNDDHDNDDYDYGGDDDDDQEEDQYVVRNTQHTLSSMLTAMASDNLTT